MKIKLGIIGFGGMGKWHADNAPRAGVEIAAVCDIDEVKQKEAVEKGFKLYKTAEKLLADPEVNTVILTVPNHLHKEMAIKAARAGKNVITEKPAALNVAELDEMEAACKEWTVRSALRSWRRTTAIFGITVSASPAARSSPSSPSCTPATATCTNGISIKNTAAA